MSVLLRTTALQNQKIQTPKDIKCTIMRQRKEANPHNLESRVTIYTKHSLRRSHLGLWGPFL